MVGAGYGHQECMLMWPSLTIRVLAIHNTAWVLGIPKIMWEPMVLEHYSPCSVPWFNKRLVTLYLLEIRNLGM